MMSGQKEDQTKKKGTRRPQSRCKCMWKTYWVHCRELSFGAWRIVYEVTVRTEWAKWRWDKATTMEKNDEEDSWFINHRVRRIRRRLLRWESQEYCVGIWKV
jgi:hypothetical protein